MERVLMEDCFGNIACNYIIIYSANEENIGDDIRNWINKDWKVIQPKYYLYGDDNCLVEIWNNKGGILLDRGLNKILKVGFIRNSWTNENRREISYIEAMEILRMKIEEGYNNKDLMSRVEDELEKEAKNCNVITNVATAGIDQYSKIGIDYARDDMVDAMAFCFYGKGSKNESQAKKQNNNGGATDYYSLPENANTLQDLIEYRNMNGSVKDIFKACYRLGIKTEDELRDLNKMAYYSLREIGRITARKDYITIAKELMGSQAIEKE